MGGSYGGLVLVHCFGGGFGEGFWKSGITRGSGSHERNSSNQSPSAKSLPALSIFLTMARVFRQSIKPPVCSQNALSLSYADDSTENSSTI